MSDLVVVIDRRDTQIELDGKTLRIRPPGGAFEQHPLGPLGLVVIHGNAEVGCNVWRALAEHDIPAVLFPGRGRGEPAYLGAGLNSSVELRMAQHRAAASPEATLRVARALLQAKLTGTEALLNQRDAREAAARLAQIRLDLANAQSPASLMGLEGSAAAIWFGHLAATLATEWQFKGRNRRPPRDPLNALLSLGYTLLAADMTAAVQTAGLDPALGFLHQIAPARAALVLDLMEPLRPSVDALSLQLLDQLFKPDDFTHNPDEGCRLGKAARGDYYAAYAEVRQDWPWPEGGEFNDPSLRGHCRRRVEWLRERLMKAHHKPSQPPRAKDDELPFGAESGDTP